MTKSLILSRNDYLIASNKPDVIAWGSIYNLLNLNVSLVDRLEYIKFPYRFINKCPMPELPSSFTLTYQDICLSRAKELFEKSKQFNKRLVLMYSGGIDSTALVISFLLSGINSKDIFLCLNNQSVNENPNFYYNHIRDNFQLLPSENSLEMLDGTNLVVGGEFNDQVFGSDIMKDYIVLHGTEGLHKKLNETDIVRFLESKGIPAEFSSKWYSLVIEHSKKSNRVQLEACKDFWWWLNFAFKWQSVYYRTILRTTNRELITDQFLTDNYNQFYDTADFQIWSMLNLDKKIGNTWNSYKMETKKMIFNYNKDQEYFDNKIKIGSLSRVFRNRLVSDALAWDHEQEKYHFISKLSDVVETYYNHENDFR